MIEHFYFSFNQASPIELNEIITMYVTDMLFSEVFLEISEVIQVLEYPLIERFNYDK